MKLTEELKNKIDSMSQLEMANIWRFAPIGEPLLQGEVGDYFTKSFKSKGFFTVEISKKIGWGE